MLSESAHRKQHEERRSRDGEIIRGGGAGRRYQSCVGAAHPLLTEDSAAAQCLTVCVVMAVSQVLGTGLAIP